MNRYVDMQTKTYTQYTTSKDKKHGEQSNANPIFKASQAVAEFTFFNIKNFLFGLIFYDRHPQKRYNIITRQQRISKNERTHGILIPEATKQRTHRENNIIIQKRLF